MGFWMVADGMHPDDAGVEYNNQKIHAIGPDTSAIHHRSALARHATTRPVTHRTFRMISHGNTGITSPEAT